MSDEPGHDFDLSTPTLDMNPEQRYCRRCRRMTDDTQACEPEPSAPALREATDAENDLIVDLSRAVGHRLLRAWDDLPASARVLPMNRAFLSAMALTIGNFLGAAAVNEPENCDGWLVLLEQTVEIIRQTAIDQREAVIGMPPSRADSHVLYADGDKGPKRARRMLIPEPKGVM